MRVLRAAVAMLVIMSGITGLAYPLAVTAAAQYLFPWQANGSIVNNPQNRPTGSKLIGQYFSGARYFWPRPSATAPVPYCPYNAADGGCGTGSNLGPYSPGFLAAIKRRIIRLRSADPQSTTPIPASLIMASGSGLDPDISPSAARYQINRVARARRMPVARLRRLVKRFTRGRTLGILGAPRVNVLELNLALNRLARKRKH